MTSIFQMNSDHRDGCPCYCCLNVGDKVFVYLDRGGKSEEIVTDIVSIDTDTIVVRWPNYHGEGTIADWGIYTDPHRSKEDCRGRGKLIRKATKKDLAYQ